MKKIISALITLFIGLMGLIMLALGLVAILDPVGTQMANDNDPFGEPSVSIFSYFITILGFLILGFSVFIGVKRGNK